MGVGGLLSYIGWSWLTFRLTNLKVFGKGSSLSLPVFWKNNLRGRVMGRLEKGSREIYLGGCNYGADER